jgi:hypothetical protein
MDSRLRGNDVLIGKGGDPHIAPKNGLLRMTKTITIKKARFRGL